MPTVSATDANTNYQNYHKSLQDMDDDYKAEAKRNEKRQAAQVAELEDNQRTTLAKKDRDTEETVNHVRSSADETLSHERKLAQQEVDSARRTTYDKFGRYYDTQAKDLRDQINHLQADSTHQHDVDLKHLSDAQAAHERKMDDFAELSGKRTEEALEAGKRSLTNVYEARLDGERAQAKQAREDAKKSAADLLGDRESKVELREGRALQAMEETRRDYQHRLDNGAHTDEALREKRARAFDGRTEQSTRDMARSRGEENRTLRDQVRASADGQRSAVSDKAQARADAIRDFESDFRTHEQTLADNYAAETQRLHDSVDQSSDSLVRKNQDRLAELQERFTKVIHQKEAEHAQQSKSDQKTFQDGLAQEKGARAADSRQSESKLLEHDERAQAQNARTLAIQGKNYQEQNAHSVEYRDAENLRLKGKIQEIATSADPNNVSPAAEQVLRQSMSENFEKSFGAEHDRTANQFDHAQQTYKDDVRTEHAQAQTQMRNLSQSLTADRQIERSALLNQIQDTEFQKNVALGDKDRKFDIQSERMNRNSASTMDEQKRKFDESLQNVQYDANTKIKAYQQASEFKFNMAQRTSSARQNEIIRDYEKKLASQKADYESLVGELKSQSATAVRESDRKGKDALDEQARLYEQRLAQTDVQQKEHETRIVQAFQDDMEKLKRSNALLIQKKS